MHVVFDGELQVAHDRVRGGEVDDHLDTPNAQRLQGIPEIESRGQLQTTRMAHRLHHGGTHPPTRTDHPDADGFGHAPQPTALKVCVGSNGPIAARV